jgi:hypothetical protein
MIREFYEKKRRAIILDSLSLSPTKATLGCITGNH